MKDLNKVWITIILLIGIAAVSIISSGKSEKMNKSYAEGEVDYNLLTGRWDVTVKASGGDYPSWFEITEKDRALSGRFVGRFGHARPIKDISFDGTRITLSLPVQYEKPKTDLVFKGVVTEGKIAGKTNADSGKYVPFSAVRAPALASGTNPEWGKPVTLIDASMSRWSKRDPEGKYGWTVKDGVMSNVPPSSDIMTIETFRDFKLHLEFKLAEKSNSGIYLRGRYEVQIMDTFGREAHDRGCGGVYGFITPSVNAVRKAGEWNTADITLIGRNVTLILNNKKIIDNEVIPGITGGAIDSKEGEPGPLLIQGDHGYIQMRNIIVTPAK